MTSPIVKAMLLSMERMNAATLPESPDIPLEDMPEGGLVFEYEGSTYTHLDGKFFVWCNIVHGGTNQKPYWRPVNPATTKHKIVGIRATYEKELARGKENA